MELYLFEYIPKDMLKFTVGKIYTENLYMKVAMKKSYLKVMCSLIQKNLVIIFFP
jgi:hypothetical protein